MLQSRRFLFNFKVIRLFVPVAVCLSVSLFFVYNFSTAKAEVKKEKKVRSIESITYGELPKTRKIFNDPILNLPLTKNELWKKQFQESHTLSASYYRVNENFDSMLMISNQGPNPMPVNIKFYNLAGEDFALESLVLNSNEVGKFNLRDILPSRNFNQGSIEVTYQGKKLEMGGVVQISDKNRSLMFDEELSEPKLFASNKLEGIWWTNQNNPKMNIVVSNTTADPIIAAIETVGIVPDQNTPKTVNLSPHQTVVLSPEEITGKNAANIRSSGGISISHNGAKGGCWLAGFCQNRNAAIRT